MSFFDRQGILEALIRYQSGTGNGHGSSGANGENSEESDSEDSVLEASVDDGFEDNINTCVITVSLALSSRSDLNPRHQFTYASPSNEDIETFTGFVVPLLMDPPRDLSLHIFRYVDSLSCN